MGGGVWWPSSEYAQLDFIANDNPVLVGGKFLAPFGVFGPRIHPTWINEFPTTSAVTNVYTRSKRTRPLKQGPIADRPLVAIITSLRASSRYRSRSALGPGIGLARWHISVR
jgi:hypothetical protein